ncbi:MAG: efflux RND transporter periplasmic adaptor subunit [Anaerolineales bacterium]|nr:efflux RND transporter periplasmic adaptor subunit [Anaerolineales bacterium]
MMNSRIAMLMVLMTIAVLLVSACGSSAQPTQAPTTLAPTVIANSIIIAEGRVEPIHYAQIAFTVSGVVSEVLVAEGQAVKKGDLLVRLGDELDTNYAAAQLELVDAQKALNDLQDIAGTDLAQAVIDLKEAQEDYDDALDRLDYLLKDDKIPQTISYRVLVKSAGTYKYEVRTKSIKGPAPQEWIIEAENDVALEKAELEAAQRTYDRLKGGVDAEQLAVLEARLTAAQAGVAAFSLTAPFDGVVAELNAKLGNSINAGESAVTIADFSHWIVTTTDLTEIDVVALAEGDPVVVSLDALPDVELTGAIDAIGQTYSENQGDVVYKVTVMLTDIDPAMRWGMTAEVKFEQ